MTDMPVGRPMVHFQIHAKDTARMQRFYQELFGWRIDNDNPAQIGLIEPGIGGPEEGVGGSIVPSDAPAITVYVQVVDLDETLRRVEAMGGEAVLPPMDVPNGPTIAQCRDPEGNLLGLVKQ